MQSYVVSLVTELLGNYNIMLPGDITVLSEYNIVTLQLLLFVFVYIFSNHAYVNTHSLWNHSFITKLYYP